MKNLAIIFSLFVLLSGGIASAQNRDNGDRKNQPVQGQALQPVKAQDASLLDRLQKETEDFSAMKPLLFLASIIEGRLDLRKAERESVAAAKARESGAR